MQNVQENQNQCFSQARELFEQIISWLNSDSVYGISHSDLEKISLFFSFRSTDIDFFVSTPFFSSEQFINS